MENCLFGAVKLTKDVDVDLYKYPEYGIRFHRKILFSIYDEVGRNVMIFGVDMTSSSHIDDKKKKYFDSTQRLEHTLTAEKLYSIKLRNIMHNLFKLAT